jgi:phenylalanyl-tRNA synthetase beta chain
MPVIELDVERLCSLIGRSVEPEKLVGAISKMGADVEGTDGRTITIEFFPDRPDLLSIAGTARALRSFLGFEPGLKEYILEPPDVDMGVEKTVLPIRGYIECLNVTGVKLDDYLLKELMELQEDLHWAVGRDRKKVAYKAAGSKKIRFMPLGMPGIELDMEEILEKHPKGREYAHILDGFDRYPIILDSKGDVLSMPPIINSELTKLTGDTTQMFVEMTGTDERAVKKAMNILASAFGEHGWKLSRVKLSRVNVRYPDKTLVTPNLKPEWRILSVKYANEMLGIDLSLKDVKKCLERIGYGVKINGNSLSIAVPAYRADILHDIDIVEDVAIGYGYENFIPELPPLPTTGSRLSEAVLSQKVRTAMVGLGFTEVVTLMLSNEDENNRKTGVKEDAVRVKNPISEEHTIIRTHLLPGILGVLCINRHRELPQQIFEVGDVLSLDSKQETGSIAKRRLGAIIIHHKANFSEAKSTFTSLLRDIGMRGKVKPYSHPSFIPGRCAEIEGVGYFGELHPRVLTNFELEYPAVAMELTLK